VAGFGSARNIQRKRPSGFQYIWNQCVPISGQINYSALELISGWALMPQIAAVALFQFTFAL